MATQFYSAFPQPEKPKPEKELELMFDTEPIIGWRIWNISKVDPVLSSVLPTIMEAIESGDVSVIQDSLRFQLLPLATTHTPWPARKKFEAECRSHRHSTSYATFTTMVYGFGDPPVNKDHLAPHARCTCGAWAVKEGTLDSAFHQYQGMKTQPFAWGEVYLWGHVIEAEKGYRARFAYPKNLTVVNGTDEMVGDLEHLYGVPVNAGGWKKAWTAPPVDPMERMNTYWKSLNTYYSFLDEIREEKPDKQARKRKNLIKRMKSGKIPKI